MSLGLGGVGSPPGHRQLPGEGDGVGGVRQTDGDQAPSLDLPVQSDQGDVIDRTY